MYIGDNWIGECTISYITERGAPTRLDLVMPPDINGSVSVQLNKTERGAPTRLDLVMPPGD